MCVLSSCIGCRRAQGRVMERVLPGPDVALEWPFFEHMNQSWVEIHGFLSNSFGPAHRCQKSKTETPKLTRVAHMRKHDVCRCICGLQDVWVSTGGRQQVKPMVKEEMF